MYCPDCGHSNNESNTFCMKCGKNLKEAITSNKVARIEFSLECAFVVVEGDTTFDECYFVRN